MKHILGDVWNGLKMIAPFMLAIGIVLAILFWIEEKGGTFAFEVAFGVLIVLGLSYVIGNAKRTG